MSRLNDLELEPLPSMEGVYFWSKCGEFSGRVEYSIIGVHGEFRPSLQRKFERPMSNNDLMDPSNPRSPYNRWNVDSPFSVTNPSSYYYDPSLVSGQVLGILILLVILAFLMFPIVTVPLAVVFVISRMVGKLEAPATGKTQQQTSQKQLQQELERRARANKMGWTILIGMFGFIFFMILLCLMMGW